MVAEVMAAFGRRADSLRRGRRKDGRQPQPNRILSASRWRGRLLQALGLAERIDSVPLRRVPENDITSPRPSVA
jgi:hypothetical protein